MPLPASAASFSRLAVTIPSRGPTRQSVAATPVQRNDCSAAHSTSRRSCGRTISNRCGSIPNAAKASAHGSPAGSINTTGPSRRAASHAARDSVTGSGPQSSTIPPGRRAGPSSSASGPASSAASSRLAIGARAASCACKVLIVARRSALITAVPSPP